MSPPRTFLFRRHVRRRGRSSAGSAMHEGETFPPASNVPNRRGNETIGSRTREQKRNPSHERAICFFFFCYVRVPERKTLTHLNRVSPLNKGHGTGPPPPPPSFQVEPNRTGHATELRHDSGVHFLQSRQEMNSFPTLRGRRPLNPFMEEQLHTAGINRGLKYQLEWTETTSEGREDGMTD